MQPFQDGLLLLQLQLSDMVHPSVVIRGAGREHKTVRPRSIYVRIDEEPHALLRLTLPQRSEGDRPSTALAHVGALDQLRGACNVKSICPNLLLEVKEPHLRAERGRGGAQLGGQCECGVFALKDFPQVFMARCSTSQHQSRSGFQPSTLARTQIVESGSDADLRRRHAANSHGQRRHRRGSIAAISDILEPHHITLALDAQQSKRLGAKAGPLDRLLKSQGVRHRTSQLALKAPWHCTQVIADHLL